MSQEELMGFDSFVETVMRDWKVPGLGLCVVEGERKILSRGYGFRDPEKKLPMTADTLYRLASNTKAFTAMSVAILVDEGKLKWDTPVRHYMPWFRLADPYATDHVTPRDLLSHRTGMPAHDWAKGAPGMTRRECMERLQYMEPSCDMRTKLQYNNWMFMVAGHLVECVTGETWEHFISERILDPLEMCASTLSFTKAIRTGNFAECFHLKDGQPTLYRHDHELDPDTVFPRAPAGGLNSTANDMAAWLSLQLHGGSYKGRQIVSEENFKVMHTPQMIDNWIFPWEELGHSSCWLGWFIWTYRGHKMVLHGGFFGSQVVLMPSKKIGMAFMPTLGPEFVPWDVVCFSLFDRLLGLDQKPWNERRLADSAKEREKQREDKAKAAQDRKQGTSPSHQLSEYGGTYEHPAYGELRVETDGGKLSYVFEDSESRNPLRHYHYDTFEALDDNGDPAVKVTFHTDSKGAISSASAPMEPAVKDIVFTRAAG